MANRSAFTLVPEHCGQEKYNVPDAIIFAIRREKHLSGAFLHVRKYGSLWPKRSHDRLNTPINARTTAPKNRGNLIV
jgi:hypothetical protein